MIEIVFVKNRKFYLEDPFIEVEKEHKPLAQIFLKDWKISSIGNYTVVKNIATKIYYKYPRKDGVIYVSDKVVFYRKKPLYLFMRDYHFDTLKYRNPNDFYSFTDSSFKLITDGTVDGGIEKYDSENGTVKEFLANYDVKNATYVITRNQHKTVLNTLQSIDVLGKVFFKHKKEIVSAARGITTVN